MLLIVPPMDGVRLGSGAVGRRWTDGAFRSRGGWLRPHRFLVCTLAVPAAAWQSMSSIKKDLCGRFAGNESKSAGPASDEDPRATLAPLLLVVRARRPVGHAMHTARLVAKTLEICSDVC